MFCAHSFDNAHQLVCVVFVWRQPPLYRIDNSVYEHVGAKAVRFYELVRVQQTRGQRQPPPQQVVTVYSSCVATTGQRRAARTKIRDATARTLKRRTTATSRISSTATSLTANTATNMFRAWDSCYPNASRRLHPHDQRRLRRRRDGAKRALSRLAATSAAVRADTVRAAGCISCRRCAGTATPASRRVWRNQLQAKQRLHAMRQAGARTQEELDRAGGIGSLCGAKSLDSVVLVSSSMHIVSENVYCRDFRCADIAGGTLSCD